ncbi:MAG: hypothetical protein Q4D32_11040 [Eubacteriales bacterium]|nr:hypothetical protein [Eubacteriales bacterium]
MNVEFGDLMGMSMTGSIMSRLQIKEEDKANGIESEAVRVLVPKAISNGRVNHLELAEYEVKKGSGQSRLTVVDDIIIKLTTPYGCALITEEDEDLVVPSYCMICRDFNPGEVDLDYLVGYLNTGYARELFTAGVAATTNSMLKPKDVHRIPVPMPPLDEQRMLGRLYRLSAEKQQALKQMLANEEALADNLITSAILEVMNDE